MWEWLKIPAKPETPLDEGGAYSWQEGTGVSDNS